MLALGESKLAVLVVFGHIVKDSLEPGIVDVAGKYAVCFEIGDFLMMFL